MQKLLAYFRKKNGTLAMVFMALVLLLSQHHLFEHELSHDMTSEVAEVCELCATAHENKTSILPQNSSIVFSAVLFLFLPLLFLSFITPSKSYFFSNPRAPPCLITY